MKVLSRLCLGTLMFSLIAACSQHCRAHFPWLTTDKDGHALLFFSENPAERDYKIPEVVSKAEVLAMSGKDKPTPVLLETIESDEFKGRRSKDKVAASSALTTTFTYGNYHGTLLKYYALHLPPVGKSVANLPKSQVLQASVAPTKIGIEVAVLWQGKPLPSAGVTIMDAEGETFEDKTDKHGNVSFSTQAEGMTGFIISHTIKSAAGEWQGEAYKSESHYCTVTTEYRKPSAGSDSKQQGSDSKSKGSGAKPNDTTLKQSRYAPLPAGIASFGAAVCEGSLYVYSGHTGKPHAHSRDNLSEGFHRLKLDGQGEWETLAMQTPLQGLPLVADEGKLYRVGGLNANNAAGDEEDIHSVDEFACYDPQSGEWMALPNLPDCRSSHDAVVLDGKVYVLGGWKLSGDRGGEWIQGGCVFDLTTANSSWQAIPALPFRRRALAVGHWDGKIIAIGGMTEDQEISQSVDCFDPATKQWSKLADFPGEGMSGFGVSAWNTEGKLFASGSDGIVYRLSQAGDQWGKVEELATPRFFHRLLAGAEGELLILGGAPMAHAEHLDDIEVINLN